VKQFKNTQKTPPWVKTNKNKKMLTPGKVWVFFCWGVRKKKRLSTRTKKPRGRGGCWAKARKKKHGKWWGFFVSRGGGGVAHTAGAPKKLPKGTGKRFLPVGGVFFEKKKTLGPRGGHGS